MTSETFVLLSGTLTFGVPLALAISEILNLGSSPRGGDEPPPPPRLPRAPTPLPECLLPERLVVLDQVPARVLEDA